MRGCGVVDDSKEATELGCLMWEQLSGAFMEVALANGLDTPAKRARLYAAFLGSVGGAMAADLGVADASFVLDMLRDANSKTARERMHAVKGGEA